MKTFSEYPLFHGPDNPRNSEGCFLRLNDGRIALAYTKYSGANWHDHCSADIACAVSDNEGATWHPWKTLVKNDTLNAMSVSLLRLDNGRIAMTYVKKTALSWNGEKFIDCRPMLCFSDDEMVTWSSPQDVTRLQPIYLVMHNDRMVQLSNGRLILPMTQHTESPTGSFAPGVGLFYLSDDRGMTWMSSRNGCYPPESLAGGLMETGIVELTSGGVMAWFRTCGNCQYKAFSCDNGTTWSHPEPAQEFPSPSAPLSMKRNPKTHNLVAVWNDQHPLRALHNDSQLTMGRTPLVMAKSTDDGRTWHDHQILENAPDHGFSYTSMLFDNDKLYLEYCCGSGCNGGCMLQDCKIRVLENLNDW